MKLPPPTAKGSRRVDDATTTRAGPPPATAAQSAAPAVAATSTTAATATTTITPATVAALAAQADKRGGKKGVDYGAQLPPHAAPDAAHVAQAKEALAQIAVRAEQIAAAARGAERALQSLPDRVEVPIRAAIATGGGRPSHPERIPGIVKHKDGVSTFYPADQDIAPFALPKDQSASLPNHARVVAQRTKKMTTIVAEDGASEQARVYRLADDPGRPRPRFTGVVVELEGKTYLRDLAQGPWQGLVPVADPRAQPGAIVEVVVDRDGPPTIVAVHAPGGSALAKVYGVAAKNGLDPTFTPDATAEAAALVADPGVDDPALHDLTADELFAIDGDGARDIDQAMHLQRHPDGGYVMRYALADASYAVKPGSALQQEMFARGASAYLPGLSIPMMPDELSSGTVSLNEGEVRRAVVLHVRLDADGQLVPAETRVIRAKVKNHRQLTYKGVEAHMKGAAKIAGLDPKIDEQIALLGEIGALRRDIAVARGVVPRLQSEARVSPRDTDFSLDVRGDLDVEKFNAEISILANTEAGRMLADSDIPGVDVPGIWKVHPTPGPEKMEALRRRIDAIVRTHALPPAWEWKSDERVADFAARIIGLAQTRDQRDVAEALLQSTLLIEEGAEFGRAPGGHHGLEVENYARFTAPMREATGVETHRMVVLVQRMRDLHAALHAGGRATTPDENKTLWRRLLLDARAPEKNDDAARAFLAEAARFDALKGDKPSAARALLDRALALPPVDDAAVAEVEKQMDLAVKAQNGANRRQGQIEKDGLKLYLDQLFGPVAAEGRRMVLEGVLVGVSPEKAYVHLREPPIEVKLYVRDLKETGDGAFFLDNHGAELRRDDGTKLVVGKPLRLEVHGEADGRWVLSVA